MRLDTFVAFALFALCAGAAVMVACGDSAADCKPGTLALQIELTGTANFADTIIVEAFDPAATIHQEFPRTPDGPHLFILDVTFPNGYPADRAITFLVRARGASTLLGENVANVHLGPSCGSAFVAIRSETLDAKPDVD